MDSQYFGAGWAVGLLAGLAIAVVLAVLVGGALLCLAVRWVEKSAPGYLRCCGAVALALVIGVAVELLLAGALAALPTGASLLWADPGAGGVVAMLVVSLVLSTLALAFAVLLVVPGGDGASIRFPRALAAAALTAAMGLVIYGTCIAVLLFALGGVPGVSR